VISLKISQITDNPRASFQCLVAQLHFRATIITTAVIYRPHSSSLFGFINEFTELCSDLNCFTNIIIVGDFNLKDVTSLDDILTMFNLTQHVSSATHDKGRLLDLVISRNDDLSVVNLNLTPGLADHHAVLFETLTEIYQLPTNNMVSRQYNKIDLDNFSIDLWNRATLPLLGIHNDISLDEFVDMWNSSITSVLDKWHLKKSDESEHASTCLGLTMNSGNRSNCLEELSGHGALQRAPFIMNCTRSNLRNMATYCIQRKLDLSRRD
jgi:hypothetical protein